MSEIPIAHLPAHWAETFGGEAIALAHDDERLTWAELDAASNRLARRLSTARRARRTTT